MLTRFTQRLGLWMSLCLLVAATVSVAMAEAAARDDEGKVEAIEIIYSSPDHNPVNKGTVIGGLAGGVIGHQIGSGRGKTLVRSVARSSETKSRKSRSRRQRNDTASLCDSIRVAR